VQLDVEIDVICAFGHSFMQARLASWAVAPHISAEHPPGDSHFASQLAAAGVLKKKAGTTSH